MNFPKNIEASENCRICLIENVVLNSLDRMFNESLRYFDLLAFVVKELQLETGTDMELKFNNICEVCENNLLVSYNFKSLCLATKDKIEKLFLEIRKRDENHESIKIEEAVARSNEDDTIPIHVLIDSGELEELINSQAEESKSHKSDDEDFDYFDENSEDKSQGTSEENDSDIKTKRRKNKELYCAECDIKFTDSKLFHTHRHKIHMLDKNLCPICGKLIATFAMEKHIMSTHTNSKDHLCTECGKRFKLGENLKKHWRIHNGDKRYTCDYCDEKFVHWNSKRSHMRTFHTGEKKYECKICNKKFAQSSNMFRHVRLHTGELPHTCEFCPKKFATSSELKHHIVTHTKERNHRCEMCDKAFGTKKALRIHHRTHTGEKNYICSICSKAFSQAHVLRTHMKIHPDCVIPPKGAVLSKKALNKPTIVPTLLQSDEIADHF